MKYFLIINEEVEIISDDIQGWLVATNNGITVALDVHISEMLKNEAMPEIVNKIKPDEKGLDLKLLTKLYLNVQNHLVINSVLNTYKEYICNETLASDIIFFSEKESNKCKRF